MKQVKTEIQAAELFTSCADAIEKGADIPAPVNRHTITITPAKYREIKAREGSPESAHLPERQDKPEKNWSELLIHTICILSHGYTVKACPDSLRQAAKLLTRPRPRAKCPRAFLWVNDPTAETRREFGKPHPWRSGGRIAAPRQGQFTPDAYDTIAAARIAYGHRAGEVLARQLAAIDESDYHPAAVKVWKQAAAMLAEKSTPAAA